MSLYFGQASALLLTHTQTTPAQWPRWEASGYFPLKITPQQGNRWRWTAQTAHALLPHQAGICLAISHGQLAPDQRGAWSEASTLPPIGTTCVATSIHSSHKNSEGLSAEASQHFGWTSKHIELYRLQSTSWRAQKEPCGEDSAIHRVHTDATCSH